MKLNIGVGERLRNSWQPRMQPARSHAKSTMRLCEQLVAPGGTIANIGVHGRKVDLHLETLWSANISITTRLVDTVSTPMLLKLVEAKKIDPQSLITHRFTLDQCDDAYDVFARAAESKALKVIIEI